MTAIGVVVVVFVYLERGGSILFSFQSNKKFVP